MSQNTAQLYYKGENHTADLLLFRPSSGNPGHFQALLIRRSAASSACPGLLAIPGGFVEASPQARRGGPHLLAETPFEAGLRELEEETGVTAAKSDAKLIECGQWSDKGRDPRNDATAHCVSHLFTAMMPEGFGADPKGLDDAEPGETHWFDLASLAGAEMAFDHGLMLAAACEKHGIPDPGARSWSCRKPAAPKP